MRKRVTFSQSSFAGGVFLLASGFLLPGTASASFALWADVPDTTLINPDNGIAARDTLGANLGFQTHNVRFYTDDGAKKLKIEIDTKMPQAGVTLSGGYFADVADFRLSYGGSDYGIALVNHDGSKNQGTSATTLPAIKTSLEIGYYSAPDWWTSEDVWMETPPNFTYALTTASDGKKIRTLMKSTASLVSGVATTVDWSMTDKIVATLDFGGSQAAMNEYAFIRSNGFDFQWGTGNCGNDTTMGSVNAVPIPAAAWLFGSALLGLAGVSRRRMRD